MTNSVLEDPHILQTIFSFVPHNGNNWFNIMITCKQWNTVGRQLFSSVSISAVIKDRVICPIVVFRKSNKYAIEEGEGIPFEGHSTSTVSLFGSALFVATVYSAFGVQCTKITLYHNHSNSYCNVEWSAVGEVQIPVSVESIHAVSSTSCMVGSRETTVFLVAGDSPSSLKLTSGFPDFAISDVEAVSKRLEERKNNPQADKRPAFKVAQMEAESRSSKLNELKLTPKPVDFFVISPDKTHAVAVDDILRPKYAIVLKLNKDRKSFTALYHSRLPSVPNERCTFGAMNNKREMLITSRYSHMRGSGNMLSLYQVNDKALKNVVQVSDNKSDYDESISGVVSFEDTFLVSYKDGVIEAFQYSELDPKKLVSVQRMKLDGKVLGMTKRGTVAHAVVLFPNELSYVILGFNQQTKAIETVTQIHLADFEEEDEGRYDDCALI